MEGKRGNTSPQTPRCYETGHDISLFPLFFRSSLSRNSSLDRKRSLPRQRVSTYSSLKFHIETFIFPRPRVFSSRPIKSLIKTPLFEIALVGIRIGRILRIKEDSQPLLARLSLS